MRVVFDENAPNKLVEGIIAFTSLFDTVGEINVTSIKLLGKLGITDEEVLEVVGANGILISYDKDFKSHKKLKKVITDHGIGVFWIQQPKRPDFFELGKFLINNWAEIMDKAQTASKPFIFQVLKGSITQIHL